MAAFGRRGRRRPLHGPGLPHPRHPGFPPRSPGRVAGGRQCRLALRGGGHGEHAFPDGTGRPGVALELCRPRAARPHRDSGERKENSPSPRSAANRCAADRPRDLRNSTCRTRRTSSSRSSKPSWTNFSAVGACPSTGVTALRTAVVMDTVLEGYYGGRETPSGNGRKPGRAAGGGRGAGRTFSAGRGAEPGYQ